jgi:hypothetical protein
MDGTAEIIATAVGQNVNYVNCDNDDLNKTTHFLDTPSLYMEGSRFD